MHIASLKFIALVKTLVYAVNYSNMYKAWPIFGRWLHQAAWKEELERHSSSSLAYRYSPPGLFCLSFVLESIPSKMVCACFSLISHVCRSSSRGTRGQPTFSQSSRGTPLCRGNDFFFINSLNNLAFSLRCLKPYQLSNVLVVEMLMRLEAADVENKTLANSQGFQSQKFEFKK